MDLFSYVVRLMGTVCGAIVGLLTWYIGKTYRPLSTGYPTNRYNRLRIKQNRKSLWSGGEHRRFSGANNLAAFVLTRAIPGRSIAGLRKSL